MRSGMGERRRRAMERTVLHRALQAGWAAFVRCGVPANGAVRGHCDGCGGDAQRLPWVDLLQRAVGIEALVWPPCVGSRRAPAAIHDPAAIARVLGALAAGLAGSRAGDRRVVVGPGWSGAGASTSCALVGVSGWKL